MTRARRDRSVARATVALHVRFRGVRGSYPVSGPSTLRVGGHSSCTEVTAGGKTLVFDAGTGIISLGRELVRRNGPRVAHIFLSHLHHDHIAGLWFFEPLYEPRWRCFVYGPASGSRALARVLRHTMAPHLFPVYLSELPARLSIRGLGKVARLRLGGRPPVVVVARHSAAHPKVGVQLYRVTCAGRSVVFATDIESQDGGYADVVDFARGADVLIHDAQYTDAEYYEGRMNKSGWGHSTVRMAAEAARAAGVGELILYHHDPKRTDAQVRRLERLARTIFLRSRAAHERMELRLSR